MGFLATTTGQAANQLSINLLHTMECRACPLNKLTQNRNPHMRPTGPKHSPVYILGEAPGKEEDITNEQFVGVSGKLLRARIPKRFRNKVRFNNVIRTRPPGNKLSSTLVEMECVPGTTLVSSIGNLQKVYRRFYSGPMITFETASGKTLTITPNHPVLTLKGFTAAKNLIVGEYLISAKPSDGSVSRDPNKNYKPTPISQIFSTLKRITKIRRVLGKPHNFHGDGKNSYVDIVSANSFLQNNIFNTNINKILSKFLFSFTNSTSSLLMGFSSLYEHFSSKAITPGPTKTLSTFADSMGSIPHSISLTNVPKPNIGFSEFLFDSFPTSSIPFSQTSNTLTSNIFPDQIISIKQFRFSDHVFNLSTSGHAYIANDFIIHNCCRPSVIEDIAATKPKIILGFGNIPLLWVAGKMSTNITDWRGRRMPVNIGGHVCWYYPLVHPSYLHRIKRGWLKDKPDAIGSEPERMFVFDMQRAFDDLDDLPEPVVHDREMVEQGVEIYDGGGDQIKQFKAVQSALQWAMKEPAVGIDYETNRSRPYDPESKILSVAVSTGLATIAWAMDHPQAKWEPDIRKAIDKLWVEFIASKAKKIVHSAMFEQEWTAVKYGDRLIRQSEWVCTLMQANTLDDRTGERLVKDRFFTKKAGPLSLDFLTRRYFGFSLKGMSNIDRKNLERTPIEKVLRYNGPDAKYHFLVWDAQVKELKRQELTKVSNQSMKRIPTCALTQVKGIPIDSKEANRLATKYEKAIKKYGDLIQNSKPVRKFKQQQSTFNPESNDDVVVLFRDILKRKEGYFYEEKDGKRVKKYSTNKKVLKAIGIPLTDWLLKFRQANKKLSTYCYINTPDKTIVWPDGKIHCNLNPGTYTDTHRLSSDDPNMQNEPKRDEGNKEVRKQTAAPPNHNVYVIDYGQIEYRGFAMASKDKRVIQYLVEGGDVHKDWADITARVYPTRIGGKAFLKDPEVMDKYRTDIKNQWTFPAFFGAALDPKITSIIGIPVEYLIKPFERFREEFSGIFDWHERLMEFYHEHGYVEDLCGRRRRGPMSRNEAINMPIQSTACQIVMDAMNRISEYSYEVDDPYYHPIIQVHDELRFILPDKKADMYLNKIIEMMTTFKFKFINVPITVEVSAGPNLLELDKIVMASSDGSWQWK